MKVIPAEEVTIPSNAPDDDVSTYTGVSIHNPVSDMVVTTLTFGSLPAIQELLPSVSIPLDEYIYTKPSGELEVKVDWMTDVLLPRIVEELQDFFHEWNIPGDPLAMILDYVDGTDGKTIRGNLGVLVYDDSGEPVVIQLRDMKNLLNGFGRSNENVLKMGLFFKGHLSGDMRKAFKQSTDLQSELNLRRLREDGTPISACVDSMSEAFEHRINRVLEESPDCRRDLFDPYDPQKNLHDEPSSDPSADSSPPPVASTSSTPMDECSACSATNRSPPKKKPPAVPPKAILRKTPTGQPVITRMVVTDEHGSSINENNSTVIASTPTASKNSHSKRSSGSARRTVDDHVETRPQSSHKKVDRRLEETDDIDGDEVDEVYSDYPDEQYEEDAADAARQVNFKLHVDDGADISVAGDLSEVAHFRGHVVDILSYKRNRTPSTRATTTSGSPDDPYDSDGSDDSNGDENGDDDFDRDTFDYDTGRDSEDDPGPSQDARRRRRDQNSGESGHHNSGGSNRRDSGRRDSGRRDSGRRDSGRRDSGHSGRRDSSTSGRHRNPTASPRASSNSDAEGTGGSRRRSRDASRDTVNRRRASQGRDRNGRGGGRRGGRRDDTGDPDWDEFERDGYQYSLGLDALIEERGQAEWVEGSDWRRHHFDPYDLVVCPVTELVPSWRAHRPQHGMVLCHPVSIKCALSDPDVFKAYYNRSRRFDSTSEQAQTKRFVQFEKKFPKLREGMPLQPWMNDVVLKAATNAFYVPPPTSVREDCVRGILLKELPDAITNEVGIMANVLADCLKMATEKLDADNDIKLICATHIDGYDAWFDLCTLIGHPALNEYAEVPSAPKQRSDETWIDFNKRYITFVYNLMLHGKFRSERYYIGRIIRDSHRSINGHAIFDKLAQDVARFPADVRLPSRYSPDHLYNTVLQIANDKGASNVVKLSPREYTRIQRNPSHGSSTVIRTLESEVRDLEVTVAALGTDIMCFICDEKHRLGPDCPHWKKMMNPRAARVGVALLRDYLNKDTRKGGSKNGGRDSKMIRQLVQEEGLDDVLLHDDADIVDGDGETDDDNDSADPDFC